MTETRRVALDLHDDLLADAEQLVPFVRRDPTFRALMPRASRAAVLRLALDMGMRSLRRLYQLDDPAGPKQPGPAARRLSPELFIPDDPKP